MKGLTTFTFGIVFGAGTMMADVSGVVRGSDSQPMQGASVVLLALPDSTYVDGTLSDDYGRFSLSGEKEAQEYMLSVQAFGHERKYLPLTGTQSGPIDITLAMASTELGEVTVHGKAPSTTRKGGKFIFTPNDLADDVSNANNLMKHVPLVSWTDEGAYITGKGLSKVLLNGRDTYWSTEEIQAMLRTLDPHCIKRVEIVTDPGATQAAAERGGVINIIYDDPSQGWRGNLSTSANVNTNNPSVSPNIWLSYQKGKFKSSANINYSYSHIDTKETRSYDFIREGRSLRNDVDGSSLSHDITGRLNLSYDLTGRSILGAGLQMQGAYSSSDNTVKTLTTENGVTSESTMRQTRRSPMKSPYIMGVVYYTLFTDNKFSMLDVVAGTSSYSKDHNYVNDFSGTLSLQDMTQDIGAFKAKASYRHIFNQANVLTVGADFTDVHSKMGQTLDGDARLFKHNERQIHGYAQFGRAWTENIMTEIGLRVENTHVNGSQAPENARYRQDYTDLFPSLNLSWNIPAAGGQSLSLSYTRMITRPDANHLNPYKVWTSGNSYSQGNPDLKASYSDNVSMYYMFLGNFIFNASYNYTYRLMVPYTINTPEGLSVTSYTNSGRYHYACMGLTYNKGLLPWWRTSADASARYRNTKTAALTQGIHASGWNCNLSWRNTFILSRQHQFSASLSQDLSSPSDRGTYKEDWKYRIIASLQKSFGCGVEVSMTGFIPVTGFKNYEKFTVPEYSYEYHINTLPYHIGLSVSYSFGKSRVQAARDRINEVK